MSQVSLPLYFGKITAWGNIMKKNSFYTAWCSQARDCVCICMYMVCMCMCIVCVCVCVVCGYGEYMCVCVCVVLCACDVCVSVGCCVLCGCGYVCVYLFNALWAAVACSSGGGEPICHWSYPESHKVPDFRFGVEMAVVVKLSVNHLLPGLHHRVQWGCFTEFTRSLKH